MQIEQTLEIFCLVEDVDQGLDIFLQQRREVGRLEGTRETNDFIAHLVLNIFAHTLLHDGRPCKSLDSGIYLSNNAHLRLR